MAKVTKKRNAADLTDRRLKPIYRDIDKLEASVRALQKELKAIERLLEK